MNIILSLIIASIVTMIAPKSIIHVVIMLGIIIVGVQLCLEFGGEGYLVTTLVLLSIGMILGSFYVRVGGFKKK